MDDRNRWGLFGGAVLIALGLVFLAGEFLSFNVWRWLWPFFILGVGAAFFVGMFAGGRGLGPLAVPGSVITTLGLILLVQNIFGIWGTWAYAWTLMIAGAGIGLIIFGGWSGVPDLARAGRVVTTVGVVLFLIFGLFFELGASLLGLRSPGGLVWPLLLIVAGLYVLVGRPLLDRYTGPVSRSVVAFEHPGGMSETPSPVMMNVEGVPASIDSLAMDNIRQVKFTAVGDLTIVQGEQEQLEIEASQAMKERIRCEVRGDMLVIRLDSDWWTWIDPRTWNTGPVRYTLTLRDLAHLESSGVGSVVIPDLSTRRFNLVQSGAGSVAIRRLMAEEIAVRQSGVGSIEVEGKVERQSLILSGTGSYRAPRLESRSASIDLSGVGSANIWVTEELNVRLTGAGSVDYAGNPRISQQVTGVGNVRHVG